MEKENVRLANQIRFIRELEGFSQEAVANFLGISQQAYQRMESGKGRICDERLNAIAAFLSIDPHRLKFLNKEDLLFGIRRSKPSKNKVKMLKNELLLIQESIHQLSLLTGKILKELELDQ